MSKGTVNKVILIGRLGSELEQKQTKNGSALVMGSLATISTYKDKDSNENIENTEWHRIVAFGKIADVMGLHCKKGSKLYIEGELKTNKWQDEQGVDRYTTQVIINNFQFMDSSVNKNDTGENIETFENTQVANGVNL